MEKKEFEVWSEGYAATGQSATAQQLVNKKHPQGKWESETFQKACRKALGQLRWDLSYYNEERNTYWGCRFFDNEKAARKTFG